MFRVRVLMITSVLPATFWVCASFAGNLFYHRNHLGGNIFQRHILVKGNVCRSTASELHAVVERHTHRRLIVNHAADTCQE